MAVVNAPIFLQGIIIYTLVHQLGPEFSRAQSRNIEAWLEADEHEGLFL